MELTNKRIEYHVTNTIGTMSLSGEVTILEDNSIATFSGQFKTDLEDYVGSFYYSETNEGKINKNISEVASSNLTKAEELVDATIVEIKASNK